MNLRSITDHASRLRYAWHRSARRGGCATCGIDIAACLLAALYVFTQHVTVGYAEDRLGEIETEHLFGFTVGSDTGTLGEREFEGSSTGRFGKRTGTYRAGEQTISAEFVPMRNLRTEFTAIVAAYDITGVSGLDDRRQAALGGMSMDLRYRLLDRATAPFGFAVGVEPHWRRADELSGASVRQYGADFVAAFDKEIVADRIVAAFNLLYQLETARATATGAWSQESTSGVAGALMAQLTPGFFVGIEARYLRHYEGSGLGDFAGHAGFIGPSLFVRLSSRAWLTAAWSSQIAGKATGEPGSLDLAHFERHQARLLFGFNF